MLADYAIGVQRLIAELFGYPMQKYQILNSNGVTSENSLYIPHIGTIAQGIHDLGDCPPPISYFDIIREITHRDKLFFTS
jgi:hypothetical protein